MPENSSKRDLLSLQEALQAEAAGSQNSEIFETLSILAEILKLQHAVELIETQGVKAVKSYLRKLVREATSKGGSKAAKSIVSDPIFKKAVVALSKCKVEHPKLEKLKRNSQRAV